MANYNLILDTKFKPFSYAEMLAPVVAATQAHQAIEEEFGNLAAKADIIENVANEQTDPRAYKMYKEYSNDLEARAEQLMRYGLNPTSRRRLLNMRARYNKEIVPIETAYKRREELAAEQRKAMAANPTLRYQRMANTISLDDFIDNPSLDYGKSYSGALLTKQVSDAVASFKKELTGKSSLQGLGLPFKYERALQHGATSAQVMAAISQDAKDGDPHAVKFLRDIVDQVLQSSGVANWADSTTMAEFRAFANEGLYNAIGETKVETFTDEYSQQNALDAAKQARANYYATQAQNNQDLMNQGNIPIDIHHLVSPDQVGERAAEFINTTRFYLGISGNLNGKFAAKLGLPFAYTSAKGGYPVSLKTRNSYQDERGRPVPAIKVFNSKGQLLTKQSIVSQGEGEADKKYLSNWYDNMHKYITSKFKADKEGHYTVSSITKQLRDVQAGVGATTMGAMRINFGADNNKKVLESLLPDLTTGDKVNIREITSFDNKGTMSTGTRTSLEDFIDGNGNIKSTPMFYAAPNANTDGLIMKFNGKTYLIPKDKLGSLGDQVYNINIPELQKAYADKQELIKKYGAQAYYNSPEGRIVEQTIDSYGAAYLRAAATTLGYSYNTPNFNIRESNQTEI